ncbi:MAG: TatD family hydrolase [Bacteroidaceae bacterium]|nr:TatD family hydrolase [Bacteroidaceae bacterium]
MYKIIDTHSHLFVEEFDVDRSEVMQRAREVGVQHVLMPNIDLASVAPMLQVCQEYRGFCYPMLGLHPTEVGADYPVVLSKLKALLDKQPQTFLAIGEVGLDLYWDKTYKDEQIVALEEQIAWALEYDLPLVIHSREAFDEIYTLFSRYKDSSLRGIFHSFTGTADEAQALLEFPGFLLGINGVATFKKSTIPEALSHVPLTRVVVETDSPYLAPVPYRGKRNESAYVVRVVEKLAEIYGLTAESVAAQTYANAATLFRLA